MIKKYFKLYVFGTLVLALILVAIFANTICPYDAYKQDLSQAYNAPSLEHIMGTDAYGRDMLSRVIVGSRVSILSTLLLVGVISIFGTFVGVICGFYGGVVDMIVMRISDLFLAFSKLSIFSLLC